MQERLEKKQSLSDDLVLSVSDCAYTQCYCEENVWMLCDLIRHRFPELLQYCNAVFISNQKRQVPIWKQRFGKSGPNHLALWDYHVVMIYWPVDGGSSRVYDLDTLLTFPSTFTEYAENALGSEHNMNSEYHRYFRVVRADLFLQHFASDRSHMRREDGSYCMPPPPHPPIHTPASSNNIQSYIGMDAPSLLAHPSLAASRGGIYSLAVSRGREYSPASRGHEYSTQSEREGSPGSVDVDCDQDHMGLVVNLTTFVKMFSDPQR